ncbi:protein FAR1-RELATED SEQUENCE 12-like [Macadamia integrifolia]|uniref:protein FAR1-RELATED SEQUENCE 12-like n=1 Tax=Macadamia integrifolia TaxID=60698 RepID=UPI001C4E667C|nr:protein FAR1-RELATED SEQUENCE 12-like [Macadamia integrifolia]
MIILVPKRKKNGGGSTFSGSTKEEVSNDQAVNLSLEGDDQIPQLRTSINELEPFVGMGFKIEDDAYNHYNNYTRQMGFSIRKFSVEHSRVDNHVLARSFVCANQGEKWCSDKQQRGLNYTPYAKKKTKCEAVMRIKSRNGKWVVDLSETEHNHPTVNPNDAFRLQSHQKVTRSTMQLMEHLQRCGVK